MRHVDRRQGGLGRCEGRGSFRLVASSREDGTTADSSWLTISNGVGTGRIRCGSSAAHAWTEQRRREFS